MAGRSLKEKTESTALRARMNAKGGCSPQNNLQI
jgi:hypothetical protein